MRQVFYYKMRQFCYQMRQLLQITTILLQIATVTTKCDIYYKLRQLLQNATFITNCDSTGLQLLNLFLYTIQGLVTYLGKDIFQEKRESLFYFW